MPFDTTDRPRPDAGRALVRERDRLAVALWLFCLAFMILVMVVLGGATRLTGSGLSIMEWAPFRGALPPLGQAEWNRLYGLYRQIPQYALVNQGFGLAGFKHIFWLEWTHRLWGRLMGVALLAPLAWFAWRGAIGRRLLGRLALLFVLGGLQGAVGWFMVASGFLPDSTAVSPYRLVAHLVLALLLYAAVLWTGLAVLQPRPAAASPALRRLARACCLLVGLTIVAGGFTAGLHAGLAYNTFPLMDGRLVPPSWDRLTPVWRNLFENIASVQFDHRVLASLTALTVVATVAVGLRGGPGPARVAVAWLGVAVLTQYALGVATLLWVVPVPLAVAHQTVAVLLLTTALVTAYLTRRA